MYGVVALLDARHCEMVEAIWAEFKREFGLDSAYLAPVPHFSYHVAERYNLEKLERELRLLAPQVKPFIVRTNGLGIFTGTTPVLYVPVIRTPLLTVLHQNMWEPVSATAVNPSPYYHPENWRPHITLAHRDVNDETLPKLVRLLLPREFNWEIRIEALAVIGDSSEGNGLMLQVPLG